MKRTTTIEAQNIPTALLTSSTVKVCIHVVRTARTDVRAIRAATALIEAGYAVSIVDVESEQTRPVEEDIRGIHMKHILMPNWQASMRFGPWFFLKAIQAFLLSIHRLLQTRADIYHANEVTALPACYLAATLRRKPLIFEAYELPPPETRIAFWRQLSWLLTRMLAFMLPRCAGVITVSPPIVQEIGKRFHVPEVTLVRNILPYRTVPKSDRLRQYLGLSPDMRIALYQGYLQADRSLDIVVRSAKFLGPGIVIVMMGKGMGTTQSELETLILNEGVSDRVKILSPVPYEELLDWTASADLGLLVCSPDYSMNIRMLLPNKLFEYLMAGLPVLASQLDAVVDVIRTHDVGQVVSSLAPADVGAAINSILADRLALARMHSSALEVARNEFCWEKERQTLIHLYQDILAGRDVK